MGKVILSEKFPCGFEYYYSVAGWQAESDGNEVQNTMEKGCPLHGKNCKNQIKKRKK